MLLASHKAATLGGALGCITSKRVFAKLHRAAVEVRGACGVDPGGGGSVSTSIRPWALDVSPVDAATGQFGAVQPKLGKGTVSSGQSVIAK